MNASFETMNSCIKQIGLGGLGEKIFDVYSTCSTVSKNAHVTAYNVVSDVAACFMKQYPGLSSYVADSCVPKQFQATFLDCMTTAKDGFLGFVDATYQKSTLFFNGNTLGAGFEKTLTQCALESTAQKISELMPEETLPTLEDSGHSFGKMITSLVLLSVLGFVLWKLVKD